MNNKLRETFHLATYYLPIMVGFIIGSVLANLCIFIPVFLGRESSEGWLWGMFIGGAIVLVGVLWSAIWRFRIWLDDLRERGRVPYGTKDTIIHFGWRIFGYSLGIGFLGLVSGLWTNGRVQMVFSGTGSCILLFAISFMLWMMIQGSKEKRTKAKA